MPAMHEFGLPTVEQEFSANSACDMLSALVRSLREDDAAR